jgi:hypothetical protein
MNCGEMGLFEKRHLLARYLLRKIAQRLLLH